MAGGEKPPPSGVGSVTREHTGVQQRSRSVRFHPARLLYLFLITLLVGILYSEIQALLTDPASALDPSQLQNTFFWRTALSYPAYFAAACILAVGAAALGWRLDQRYTALQADRQREETVVAVMQRVQARPAGSTAPRDLPPRAPGFVGRQHDLTTLSDSLRPTGDGVAAVAVMGMGGLGKSSLAAEAAHTLAAEPNAFPGGVNGYAVTSAPGIEGLVWIEDQLLAAWGRRCRRRRWRGRPLPRKG
jgi:hypothetical protein